MSEPTVPHQLSDDDASSGPNQSGTVVVDRSAFSRSDGLFVINQGPKAGARYALDTDPVTLGRHPSNDIFLDDITVSHHHAEVFRADATFRIRDLSSLNGTYVNSKIIEDTELAEGDEVQIGRYKMVFLHGTAD